ncbi:SDR family NAD(P)-dependent oxidoreductase [Thiosocius teredinicola]|uniref:SDR family NAD(P)-dependent oxidoreductase n=1 Tax=Thiosocius teredinicola TaxID=1973002 RepID=UPI0013DDA558
MSDSKKIAVIAGIGDGLGFHLSTQLAAAGYRVAGLARSAAAGERLSAEIGNDRFVAIGCDVSDAEQVDAAVSQVEQHFGQPAVYIHNAATLHHQEFLNTAPADFELQWRTSCLGAVHGAQRVLPAMLQHKAGTLLLIGATASIKAGAGFAAFGSAKFALRGLGQSLAREYGPKGIHVAHLIIDGVMWGQRARDTFRMREDQCLDPAAVAQTCLTLIEQPRSAWTHELDIRPDVETF